MLVGTHFPSDRYIWRFWMRQRSSCIVFITSIMYTDTRKWLTASAIFARVVGKVAPLWMVSGVWVFGPRVCWKYRLFRVVICIMWTKSAWNPGRPRTTKACWKVPKGSMVGDRRWKSFLGWEHNLNNSLGWVLWLSGRCVAIARIKD